MDELTGFDPSGGRLDRYYRPYASSEIALGVRPDITGLQLPAGDCHAHRAS